MIKFVLLAGLAFLTACSSTSQFYRATCVNPDATDRFVYDGFRESSLQDNTLELTNKNHTIYYSIPSGTACRIEPMETQFERQD